MGMIEGGESEASGWGGSILEEVTIEGDSEEEGEGVVSDTEMLVEEALQRLPPGCAISCELRVFEVEEQQVVEEFMVKGCSCRKWGGKPCSGQFSAEYVKKMRLSCMELTREQLDMFLMGQLTAFTNNSTTVVVESRHRPDERQRGYANFFHQGKSICATTFKFLHGIGHKRLRNVSKALHSSGVVPRIHGNTKRLPKHALSVKSTQFVVRFLLNYCELNGLLLPGRVPGYSRDDIKLLPSSTSKRGIWQFYCSAAQVDRDDTQRELEADRQRGVATCLPKNPWIHVVAYTTFCRLWKALLPQIILMKPMTDLCWTCQQNSSAILRAANFPDRAKSDTVAKAMEHLRIVQVERSHYKTTCKECEREIRSHFTTGDEFHPPPLASQTPANSVDIKAHYSFDYAQQVHYPSDPLQPGPIYFLTPRKCAVFGVACEAIPRQVNFLADEAGSCGKGANTVVSQLHYFFEHHGLGEKAC